MKYKIIIADPPWPIKKIAIKSRPNQSKNLSYPTMPIEQIKNLPIAKLADDDCNLFLWSINKYLDESFDVIKSWGFIFQRLLTWDKKSGMNYHGFHHRTEFCLHAVKKKRKDYFAYGNQIPTIFQEKARVHSQKPEILFQYIEQNYKGPYLELFARQKREGWHAWGNEVKSDIEL